MRLGARLGWRIKIRCEGCGEIVPGPLVRVTPYGRSWRKHYAGILALLPRDGPWCIACIGLAYLSALMEFYFGEARDAS